MKKILVAEDTESNYLLLSIILRKEYEVHRAHDGQEAIEKFESCRPDMILMDIKNLLHYCRTYTYVER